MKKFLLTLLLFFLPLILFLGGLELGLRSIPNNYHYKNQWLTENVSNVKILILGSSHGERWFRSENLSELAFNAAHPSQSIKYDAFIFDKFFPKADSLQTLVWPISYFSIPSTMEMDDEWWRIKGYCIYYDCPYHPWEIRYQTELFGTNLYFNMERVWTMLNNQDYSEIYCDSLGWCPGNKNEAKPSDWYACGKDRANRHAQDLNKSHSIIEENINTIENVIRQCAQRNVRVVLVTTPTYRTYYENVNPNQVDLMVTICDSLTRKYDNVCYLNLFTDNRFNEDDFFDTDHASEDGATKITAILDDYLTKLE